MIGSETNDAKGHWPLLLGCPEGKCPRPALQTLEKLLIHFTMSGGPVIWGSYSSLTVLLLSSFGERRQIGFKNKSTALGYLGQVAGHVSSLQSTHWRAEWLLQRFANILVLGPLYTLEVYGGYFY